MPVGVLRSWNRIGFAKNIFSNITKDVAVQLGCIPKTDEAELPLEELVTNRIVEKFTNGRIKTQKLYDGFFDFRLNDHARVICKSDDQGSIIVVNILPLHKGPLNAGEDTKDATFVTLNPNATVDLEISIPPLSGASFREKTVILSKTQSDIAATSHTAAGFHIINGIAGSGKTTIAEIIMSLAQNNGKKALFVAESQKLVQFVKEQHKPSHNHASVTIELEDIESKDDDKEIDIEFKSYQDLAKPIVLEELFTIDSGVKFKSWVSSFGADSTTSPNKAKAKTSTQPKHKKTKDKAVTDTLNDDLLEFISNSYQEDLLHNIFTLYTTGKLSQVQSTDIFGKAAQKDITPQELTAYHQLLSCYLEKKIFNEHHFIYWLQNGGFGGKYSKSSTSDLCDLYQDMCKSAVNGKIGKKQAFGKFTQQQLSDLLNIYKGYLKDTGSVDLSISITSRTPAKDATTQYDVIIVDESHDLTKAQIEYIISYMTKGGTVYFLRDGNQSITDTFNITQQYIVELATKHGVAVNIQNLEYSYRMPKIVTKFTTKLLKIKDQAIGGRLEKGSLTLSTDPSTLEYTEADSSNDGFIGFIDTKDDTHYTRLRTLQEDVKNIADTVVVIPDEALRNAAERDFPESLILTPKQVKGLEYQKVVLYNFISGNYECNFFKDGEALQAYDANSEAPQNFPQDISRAKYAIQFNKLFTAITRTTKDLVFVETDHTSGLTLFQTIFQGDINQGVETKLEAITIEKLLRKIDEDSSKMDADILLKYLDALISKIITSHSVTAKDRTEIESRKILEIIEFVNLVLNKQKQWLSQDKAAEITQLQDALSKLEQSATATIKACTQPETTKHPVGKIVVSAEPKSLPSTDIPKQHHGSSNVTYLLSEEKYVGGFTTSHLHSLLHNNTKMAIEIIKNMQDHEILAITPELYKVIDKGFPGTSGIFYLLLRCTNQHLTLQTLYNMST